MTHHLELQATERDKVVDVVIVGAGMAGLAAADRLRRSGIHNFVILEASNR